MGYKYVTGSIQVVQDRIRWHDLINSLMASQNVGDFVISIATVSFSKAVP
jgi:hypothetical protein